MMDAEETSNDRVADLLYEVGHLRRVARSGWRLAGVTDSGESVAEHSHRAAVVALVLAAMSGVDDSRIVKAVLLHDLAEARTGDDHHVARRYRHHDEVERKVVADQTTGLPDPVLKAVLRAIQTTDLSELERSLAHDADVLDAILFVRETFVTQPLLMEEWTTYLKGLLVTDAGIELLKSITRINPHRWWIDAVRKPPAG
jgi:putative hydrolases of HD superfamily